jgi:TatD DNase family protein
LPLIVHSRQADETMAAILEEEHASAPFRILMHCYTSGADLARRVAALGAWFSVSGIATFKAADDVRAVIADMPAARIVVETDCPYLAPAPMRGRRNEPAFLPHVLAALAGVRGWSLAEAEERTQDAFFALFDKIPRP